MKLTSGLVGNKMNENLIYKEQIIYLLLSILEIAGHENQYSKNFEADYKKWLKFQKETDWKRYRACVDLLTDTDYAIVSAFQYQLGNVHQKCNDHGELHIRLYGILNAVYLQIGAYLGIAKLLNFPDLHKVKKTFNNFDIMKLRNIAGSHTASYLFPDDEHKELGISRNTSFRIIYTSLTKRGDRIRVLDENNINIRFNLIEILTEYDQYSLTVLVSLINHMIKSVVKSKKDKMSIKQNLNELLPNLIHYPKLNKNIPN